MLHAQIVLCCVACSYLDIKQIEAACLLFVRCLPMLHYVVYSLHSPFLRKMWLSDTFLPNQGCQELSCTEHSHTLTSVSLLSRCTWAPTERHSSPVEALLTGSKATLPGLIEIPRSPQGTRHY